MLGNFRDTITITFGDQAENNIGMEIIGNKRDKGLSIGDLKHIVDEFTKLNVSCEYYDLTHMKSEHNEYFPDAAIIIVRNSLVNKDELYNELSSLEWDKKYKDRRRNKVLNKIARHNLIFDDKHQDADFDNNKGTIYSWDEVQCLKNLKEAIENLSPSLEGIVAEGNRYYDTKKCGIGFHGDTERTIVVGCRFGASMSLCYQWFHKNEPVSERVEFMLNHGDIYFMSENAVGNKWKCSSLYTLRHSAGCAKYTTWKKKNKKVSNI